MRFSHSLQLNAVPEWTENYIAYGNLKKLIYSLERRVHQQDAKQSEDLEGSSLLDPRGDVDETFRQALDCELEKICSFYHVNEREICHDFDNLLSEAESYHVGQSSGSKVDDSLGPSHTIAQHGKSRRNSILQTLGFHKRRGNEQYGHVSSRRNEHVVDNNGVDESLISRSNTAHEDSFSAQHSENMTESYAQDSQANYTHFPSQGMSVSSLPDGATVFKKRIIDVYVSLCQLVLYVQLNGTGFSKALKKFDKTLNRDLRRSYLEKSVRIATPFSPETALSMKSRVTRVETIYADYLTDGDLIEAKRELGLHLREQVIWERNTVWRDLIGIERRAQGASLGVINLIARDRSSKIGDGTTVTNLRSGVILGSHRLPGWLFAPATFSLLASIAIFAVVLTIPILQKTEQHNCLALVVFVSCLWATEAIPLFVTALLIPFLSVVLRVVRDESTSARLDANSAASVILSAMWTPVIMLLIGGFTIAAALSKYNIAKSLATYVLSKAGPNPRTILLIIMFIAMISSMLVSNVAAPVLCLSILQPILRNLPPESNTAQALVLGVALASNIGGAASPIASPQNLIALQQMDPSPGWGVWFFISLPVCTLSIVCIWLLLVTTLKPESGLLIVRIKPGKDKYNATQWFIIIITSLTILLWCISHRLEPVFGDMGIVAIIPLVMFFGTGILSKEDFNNFLWTIVILAAGGLSLGKAVSSSGLLHTVAEALSTHVEGLGVYSVLLVFTSLILVGATFISHTVAAVIVLPLVHDVGAQMADPHPNLLVMSSALICSVAMGLPTSGFPNITAIMTEDDRTGKRYLTVKHFLTRGILSSLIGYAIIVSLGYGLMLIVDI